MIKTLFMMASGLLFLTQARAADQQVQLATPRGQNIKIDIYNPGMSRALLLGQGQGCSARLDLYDALALEAKAKGITLVRLYWAYCVANPGAGGPSDDLSTESEDFLTAMHYVKNELKIKESNLLIGGKSLGSLVSYPIFRANKKLPTLVMLTPVCTDTSDTTSHKNVFAESYPGLADETRRVVFVQGSADPICEPQHFREYLSAKSSNFLSLQTNGDHSLGIKKTDGEYSAELGANNLKAIAKWLFAWLP